MYRVSYSRCYNQSARRWILTVSKFKNNHNHSNQDKKHQSIIQSRQIPKLMTSSSRVKVIQSPTKHRIETDPHVIQILSEIDFDSDFDSTQSQDKSWTKSTDVKKEHNEGLVKQFDSFEFGDEDDDLEILKAAESFSRKKSNRVMPPSNVNTSGSSIRLKRQSSDLLGNILKQARAVESNKFQFVEFDGSDIENDDDFSRQKSMIKLPSFSQDQFITSSPIIKKPSLQPIRYFSTSTIPQKDYKVKNEPTNIPPAKTKPKIEKPKYATLLLSTQNPTLPEGDKINLEGLETAGKTVKPIILSAEQQYVLSRVMDGASLFYTGSAGTGKSVLLRHIIKELRRKYSEGVFVTASTGLAACNIGGTTLHSFAGVGLGALEVEKLIDKVRRHKTSSNKWRSAKVLIIDEISMVDGVFFDKLDQIARAVRKCDAPFGGIQMVICGDFYQLPPVVKNIGNDGKEFAQRKEVLFAFECRSWLETIRETIILKEVFRQKGDQTFIDMLNELRDGRVSERTCNEFLKLKRDLVCPPGITPAEIYATRNEVERANNFRLGKLKGTPLVFKSIDGGVLENPQKQNVLSNFLAPAELLLKKDAQVMCIKNIDSTIVNGSLGQVIDFMDRDTYMKAQEQGDINYEEGNDSSDYIFDRSTSEMSANLSKEELDNLQRKQQIREEFSQKTNNKKYPLVKFLSPSGETRTILVEPEQWSLEDDKETVLVSRVQIPLMLAWSLSIHKSQGQTLPKVKVDLRKVFEDGQAYVALSRAVSREGLQVLNFDESKVRAHSRVVEFYKTLRSVGGDDSGKATVVKNSGQSRINEFFRGKPVASNNIS